MQMQRVGLLTDVMSTDGVVFEAGMTKCFRRLPGPDQEATENSPFPEPTELQGDIKALLDGVTEPETPELDLPIETACLRFSEHCAGLR